MAIGQVTKYNGFQKNLMKANGRQWDDPAVGNLMFVLATEAYTPSAAHETAANIGAALITTGPGAPINLTGQSIDDTTTPGRIYFDSNPANFGSNVTISAKYLICVQPITPGTFANTAKLLWYVDLNTLTPTSIANSINSVFRIDPPENGWLRV